MVYYSDPIIQHIKSPSYTLNLNLQPNTRANIYIPLKFEDGGIPATLSLYDISGAYLTTFTINTPTEIEFQNSNISTIVFQFNSQENTYIAQLGPDVPISYTIIYFENDKEAYKLPPFMRIRPLNLISPQGFTNGGINTYLVANTPTQFNDNTPRDEILIYNLPSNDGTIYIIPIYLYNQLINLSGMTAQKVFMQYGFPILPGSLIPIKKTSLFLWYFYTTQNNQSLMVLAGGS